MPNPKIPPKDEVEKLYKKYQGNIAAAARGIGKARSTVDKWMISYGLNGSGKGGTHSNMPPKDELESLVAKYGTYQDISVATGWNASTVRAWCNKLGISSNANLYRSLYPQVVNETLEDGYVVAFSDAHFWFEEKSRAHQALLPVLKKLKPVIVIANGDILDGAKISRHDPSGVDALPALADELHCSKQHMAEIARACPQAKRYFTLGNHDSRLSRYVARVAPELEDVDGTRLDHHFMGWQFCVSMTINSDVVVKHAFRGGIHATYNNTLHDGRTTVTGHLHAQMVRPFTDARGTRYGVDLGCLADPHWPQFNYALASTKNWRSGFGVLEFRNGKLLPPMLASVLDDGSVYLQRNERVI